MLEKEAQEELVCDMLSRMFADQNAYDVLMELKQQDLNLFQKLGQAIKKLLDKLKNLLGVYDNQTPDFKYAASVENFGEEAFRQLQEMYMRAFVMADANFQTAEKNTTEDGDVMYMSRDVADVTEDTVRADLTDVFNGNNVTAASYIPLLKTTPFAVRYITGYTDDLPVIVEKKKAYFDMREDGKFKEDSSHHYHGMGVDGFINAIDILNDPEYAIREQMKNGKEHFAFISTNENGEEVCIVFEMAVYKPKVVMNGYPDGFYNLDITEFVATEEWLEAHGVEPGTSYKDHLLSFSSNSLAYDRKIHFEQLEKARNIEVGSAGLAASHINNRAFNDKLAQSGTAVKSESAEVTNVEAGDNGQKSSKRSDRDYSYEALTSKPDMVVTTVDSNIPKNRADVVALAKKNAAKVGKFNTKTGSVSVYVKDIGKDVVLGTIGLKHGLDGRRTENSIVTVKAGEILQNSIRINELTPKKEEAYSSYVLIGAARSDSGDLYIVRSVVNTFKNELMSMDVLYAINAKKGNRLRSMRPGFQGPVTDSTISIAKLLDDVNNYFPDILPEEVLKHYGHDARPEGELGESALYQERDPDSVSNRSLLANAFENVAQNEIEKQKIQEYKEKISFIDAEEQKLHELNEEIKKLSFAKGPRDTKAIQKLQLEAKQTANRISIYDNQLLRLEG